MGNKEKLISMDVIPTISRDEFTDLVMKNFNGDCEMLLDAIEEGITLESFKLWYFEEEVYILHLTSGTLINWYKITHIGRCLQCNKELSIKVYNEFFRLLYKELTNKEQ